MARSVTPAAGTGGRRPPPRKAAKPRDFQKEYQARLAKARREGRSKQSARGHARESEEKKARRARVKAQYGVTPERLAKLRREAATNLKEQLRLYPTKGPILDQQIERTMRALSPEGLAIVIGEDGRGARQLASLSYEEIIEMYPDLENDLERNPFWYHP